MKLLTIPVFLVISAFCLLSCNSKRQDSTAASKANILVEATRITTGQIPVQLRYVGKTTFFNKNTIASPISGYIAEINTCYGKQVKKGDFLLSILTKEERALAQSAIPQVGQASIPVYAPSDGYISEMNVSVSGAFVQEGNSLCVITEDKHPVVLIQIPYAEQEIVRQSNTCEIILPDQKNITGTFRAFIPNVEAASQTIPAIIQPMANRVLPENMMVSATFTLPSTTSLIVPKEALFTNETQSVFWVIKLLNDSLAIHVPVACSTENDSLVSIASPILDEGDWVITKGGYGLADSAIVSRTN